MHEDSLVEQDERGAEDVRVGIRYITDRLSHAGSKQISQPRFGVKRQI